MKRYLYLLVALLAFSCSGSKKTTDLPVAEPIEFRELDTLVVSDTRVSAEELDSIANTLPIYQSSHERTIDILHTSLDIRFDWEAESVLGFAEITFTPYFYTLDSFELDAKGFEIESIVRTDVKADLDFFYDGEKIIVYLPEKLYQGQERTIAVKYTAYPGRGPKGGSTAITSDQGLFFINADGTEDKPQQIWTQGETEHNSNWFPTVDKPNERMTTDILLTVEDRFKTLSNGVLVESKSSENGYRTDHWKMDQPHAPYLVMIAVGEYVRVPDQWQDIELGYWVEPEYEEDASYIFENTPEMLSFFSDLLGIPYPWQNYDQVVVRDYVSGAMENTTAVVFGEFVQRKKRDLIDDNNDRIVAHEMIHHWFGNLVTLESWSNLTLNEGFANYSEHLWRDHHYGKHEGQAQLFDEKLGYLYSGHTSGLHPLIRFGYEDKEDVFDAHSYNKGGLVLHMLRHEVGDKAFFAGLKHYLKTNAYSSVEVHDLRLAMEKVTGRDLNWFFNQWFFSAGHPELDIEYHYDADDQALRISVEQTQDPEISPPIFQLPAVFDVYIPGDTVQQHEFWLNQRSQEFTIRGLSKKPSVVNFNPDHVLLAPADQNFSTTESTHLVNHADHVAVILENLQAANPILIDVERLLRFPAYEIQLVGLDLVNPGSGPEILDLVKEMASEAENSFVRAQAILLTTHLGQPLDEVELIALAQSQEVAYRIVNAALSALNMVNPKSALEVIGMIDVRESPALIPGVAQIFADSRNVKHLAFFEKNKNDIRGQDAIPFYASYLHLLGELDFQDMEIEAVDMVEIASASEDLFLKYGVIRGLADVIREEKYGEEDTEKLRGYADQVVESVEDLQYRNFFKSLLKTQE